jgi:thioredoxin-dependent peroxiredoxin
MKALFPMLPLLATGLLLAGTTHASDPEELAPGAAAPEFSLPDQTGATRILSTYRSRWVVLYFYPRDDTPGCTTEACAFRDAYLTLTRRGVEVLGVSVDNRDNHAEFAHKYHLPFPLLADTDGAVARRYGALWSIGIVRFARRHTFIIDPAGRIAKIYRSVDPDVHSREVQTDLETLQRGG